jgi:hypothetical protein
VIHEAPDYGHHLNSVDQATISQELSTGSAGVHEQLRLPPGLRVHAGVEPLVSTLVEANQELGRLRAEYDSVQRQNNAKEPVIAELRAQLKSGQLRQRHLEDLVQAARARIDQLHTDSGQSSVQAVEATSPIRSALLPLSLPIKQLRIGPLDASMLIWLAGLACIVVARFVFQLAAEFVFVAALAVLLLSVAVRRYRDQAG